MDRLNGLALWLADHADQSITAFHEGFCQELVARGVPLSRSSLGVEVLHPEQSGRQFVWTAESEGAPKMTPSYHGVEHSSDYLLSPIKVVDETGQPFLRKLDGPILDMPLLEELRLDGATGYGVWPLPFLERSRTAFLSFATKAATGFSDSDLDLLADAARLFSPYAERRALRRLAIDLLETYVGHHSSVRIFEGQIRRGAIDTIEAAILMCDMRNFTARSKRAELESVVALLDDWFERIETAVEANGGEILKFMGDGLLAIFRSDPDRGEACRRAHSAALQAGGSLLEMSAAGVALGKPPLGFAMGLHVGEVAYGNVGGRHRLDFTVLGPAVNYASRLQELAKRLGRQVLISHEFAQALPDRMESLGVHPLRGIGHAEQIYGARSDSAAATSGS